MRKHADDIVDTWRIDHIINAIIGYTGEYRQQQEHLRQSLAELPPLPVNTPDEVLEAEPTPDAPDEAPPAVHAGATLPRDVLFRDLGSFVPGRMPLQQVRRPRWWWPLSQRIS